jgi:hypothetical protein
MPAMIRKTPAIFCAALLFVGLVHAQSSTRQILKANTTPTVIPVWNVHSGQIEALLVLESNPASTKRAWVKAAEDPNIVWPGQKTQNVNLDSGMAIFCSGQANTFNQLSLLGDCALGKKSSQYPAINSPGLETKALLQRRAKPVDGGLLSSLSAKDRQLLATEFDSPATPPKSLNLSPANATDGWVSINGNLTRGKLIPASQFPKGVPTEWDKKTFELPEREKALSGEVVGNVVQIPGQDSNLQSIGAGLSWKTPWKGKVSLGAESVLSQGRSTNSSSPQAPIVDQRVDGVTPYVRVEIDL